MGGWAERHLPDERMNDWPPASERNPPPPPPAAPARAELQKLLKEVDTATEKLKASVADIEGRNSRLKRADWNSRDEAEFYGAQVRSSTAAEAKSRADAALRRQRHLLSLTDTEEDLQSLLAADRIDWRQYEQRIEMVLRHHPEKMKGYRKPRKVLRSPESGGQSLTRSRKAETAVGAVSLFGGLGIVATQAGTLLSGAFHPWFLVVGLLLLMVPRMLAAIHGE